MTAAPAKAPVQNGPLHASADLALRTQRDRFVGFAFAAADLLLEIDRSGDVCFGSGAARRLLGVAADALSGSRFVDFVAADDKPLVGLCFYSLKDGDRLDPVRLTIRGDGEQTSTAMMGACRIPGRADSLYVTLTRIPSNLVWQDRAGERDTGSGLLSAESFQHATELLTRGNAGRNSALTLLKVQGLDAASDDPEEISRFLQGFGRLLRVRSIGDAAGFLGNGKYGVVHDKSWDPGELERSFEGLARTTGGRYQGVTLERSTTVVATEETQRLGDMIRRFAGGQPNRAAPDKPAPQRPPGRPAGRRQGQREVWG